MPVAPAVSCALGSGGKHTSNNEYTGITRHPRTQWFYGLCRALPGDRAFLPPSSRGYVLSKPGWADATPQHLTPASGRQDHTILPSAKSVSRQRAVDRSQISRSTLRSHRAQNAAASTASAPRVRDDRDTPLWWGGMRKVLDLIWGEWEQKYFSENQK